MSNTNTTANVTADSTDETEVKKYTPDAFIKDEKYKKYRSVLETLLDENESYTIKEAESRLKKFLKGEVK